MVLRSSDAVRTFLGPASDEDNESYLIAMLDGDKVKKVPPRTVSYIFVAVGTTRFSGSVFFALLAF